MKFHRGEVQHSGTQTDGEALLSEQTDVSRPLLLHCGDARGRRDGFHEELPRAAVAAVDPHDVSCLERPSSSSSSFQDCLTPLILERSDPDLPCVLQQFPPPCGDTQHEMMLDDFYAYASKVRIPAPESVDECTHAVYRGTFCASADMVWMTQLDDCEAVSAPGADQAVASAHPSAPVVLTTAGPDDNDLCSDRSLFLSAHACVTATTRSLRFKSTVVDSSQLQRTLSLCAHAVLSDYSLARRTPACMLSAPIGVGLLLLRPLDALRSTVEICAHAAAESLVRRLQHVPGTITLSNECADYLCLASESWLQTFSEVSSGNL